MDLSVISYSHRRIKRINFHSAAQNILSAILHFFLQFLRAALLVSWWPILRYIGCKKRERYNLQNIHQSLQKAEDRLCDMDPGEQVFSSPSLVTEYLHLGTIFTSNLKNLKSNFSASRSDDEKGLWGLSFKSLFVRDVCTTCVQLISKC